MKDATGSSRREEQKEETRRRLLEATVDCIEELGYHRTTSTEVARRAEVAQGTFFYHFPTKLDLMVALCPYILDLMLTRTEAFYLSLSRAAPELRVSSLLDYIRENDYSGRYAIALDEIALAARSDLELAARIAPDLEENSRGIEDRWERNLVSTRDNLSLTVIRRMVYTFMDGLPSQTITDPAQRAALQELFEAWKALILPLLAPKETAADQGKANGR